ncbi:MAG: AMP-binding protein [Thermodesulfobacteriota bacterium]
MNRTTRIIEPTESAYPYPLTLKQLLHTPITYAANQEIVYRDTRRHTYADVYSRINRLASSLADLGVKPGDMVAVMDWDFHRYLECFFAIPMMGAVLHTVNIRLSPEQILFTMNHAADLVVITHEDFLPILEAIRPKLETVKQIILIREGYPMEPNWPEPRIRGQ